MVGEGDIRGIIDKLDYFTTLGVDYLWLTPVYESPMNDNGYDISNYYEVNPQFGTKADLEELLEKAHARGLKIMMDIVINHTSTEHHWFVESSGHMMKIRTNTTSASSISPRLT